MFVLYFCHAGSVLGQGEYWQTCQVSMLRISEKFAEPPKNVSSVARKIFGGLLRGSGGMLPQKKFENYVSKIG